MTSRAPRPFVPQLLLGWLAVLALGTAGWVPSARPVRRPAEARPPTPRPPPRAPRPRPPRAAGRWSGTERARARARRGGTPAPTPRLAAARWGRRPVWASTREHGDQAARRRDGISGDGVEPMPRLVSGERGDRHDPLQSPDVPDPRRGQVARGRGRSRLRRRAARLQRQQERQAPPVPVEQYAKGFADGKWHKVEIPISAFYKGPGRQVRPCSRSGSFESPPRARHRGISTSSSTTSRSRSSRASWSGRRMRSSWRARVCGWGSAVARVSTPPTTRPATAASPPGAVEPAICPGTAPVAYSGDAGIPSADPAPAGPYAWKNVVIKGGGFVSGIVMSPALPGLAFARTDVGGAYRYDPANQRWMPLTDWVASASSNLMGIESIATDPTDPNQVYLAAGEYLSVNGSILSSTDMGRTWKTNAIAAPMGGNADGRSMGERLAVDPNLPERPLLRLAQRGAVEEHGLGADLDAGRCVSHLRHDQWLRCLGKQQRGDGLRPHLRAVRSEQRHAGESHAGDLRRGRHDHGNLALSVHRCRGELGSGRRSARHRDDAAPRGPGRMRQRLLGLQQRFRAESHYRRRRLAVQHGQRSLDRREPCARRFRLWRNLVADAAHPGTPSSSRRSISGHPARSTEPRTAGRAGRLS